MEKLKNIPGFTELKAHKHGRYWYIIDCSPGSGDPFRDAIGGFFEAYGLACGFAIENYSGWYL